MLEDLSYRGVFGMMFLYVASQLLMGFYKLKSLRGSYRAPKSPALLHMVNTSTGLRRRTSGQLPNHPPPVTALLASVPESLRCEEVCLPSLVMARICAHGLSLLCLNTKNFVRVESNFRRSSQLRIHTPVHKVMITVWYLKRCFQR